MSAAGIDISKGKSMVSVLRPLGEVVAKPFAVRHTDSELRQLADYLKSLDGETRVITEHTGRYYEPAAQFLHDAGLYVSAVNPKLIKDYIAVTLISKIHKNPALEPQGIPFAFKIALNNTEACRQDTVILFVTSLFFVNPVSSRRKMPAIIETAVIYRSSSFLKRFFG